MQVYGRGLKRRLPPMLGGDPRRVRMAYSLMFSLPGTPTLYYGEELGMGEDLEAPGRMAVRTPMQWGPGRNGDFSTAAPGKLIQRVVPDGYGPKHVNFADQEHDPDSLWAFLRTLIGVRRRRPELGWGDFSVIPTEARAVLAHRVSLEGSAAVAVHNFSADPVSVSLPAGAGYRTRTNGAVLHVERLPPDEVARDSEGYPVTSLVRTAVDLASGRPLPDAIWGTTSSAGGRWRS